MDYLIYGNNMATLTISHHIYLTDEQRYKIHNGESLSLQGIAIPVWFYKGSTSEPAQEIFCHYTLKNDKSGTNVTFSAKEGRFIVNMPHIEIISGDAKIDYNFKKVVQNKVGTSDNLLDPKDGGTGFCEFKFYHKLEIDKKLHHLIHFVEIKPIDMLDDTLGSIS